MVGSLRRCSTQTGTTDANALIHAAILRKRANFDLGIVAYLAHLRAPKPRPCLRHAYLVTMGRFGDG